MNSRLRANLRWMFWVSGVTWRQGALVPVTHSYFFFTNHFLNNARQFSFTEVDVTLQPSRVISLIHIWQSWNRIKEPRSSDDPLSLVCFPFFFRLLHPILEGYESAPSICYSPRLLLLLPPLPPSLPPLPQTPGAWSDEDGIKLITAFRKTTGKNSAFRTPGGRSPWSSLWQDDIIGLPPNSHRSQ